MKNLPYILLAFLALLSFYLVMKVASLEEKLIAANPPAKQEEKKEHEEHEAHGEQMELAVMMARFQRYADKLYFAGKSGNWALARFYVHEIEETKEDIEKAHVVDDGMDISLMLQSTLSQPLENVSTAVGKKSAAEFEQTYPLLVRNCNNCHAATKHEFIQIKVPTQPTYQNQIF